MFFIFSGDISYPTKPAKILLNLQNSCIKRLLSDGFNMAAIKNSLMKSRRTSNFVRRIKRVILLENFTVGLINFVNLSTTFFIQRLSTFFILEVNVFYIHG